MPRPHPSRLLPSQNILVDQQIKIMDRVLALKRPINDSFQQHRVIAIHAETRLLPDSSDELHSHAASTGRHPHGSDLGMRPYDRGSRRVGTAAGGVGAEGPGGDLSESGASMCVTGFEVEDAWCQPLLERLMPHLRLNQRSRPCPCWRQWWRLRRWHLNPRRSVRGFGNSAR